VARPLVRIPEATFLDGITHLSKDTFLIADAVQGEIWRLNITSAEYSSELSNSALLPASSSETKIGVNGLKVQPGYVYLTSTSKGIYGRIPITRDAEQTGPMEILASGFTLDDFYLAPDGSAYLATNSENRLFGVSPSGRVQLVVGGLNELTVAGLTSVARSWDGRTLYVTRNGGMSSPVSCALVEPAKIVAAGI
jgi:sugar lactone lactonase YvrE